MQRSTVLSTLRIDRRSIADDDDDNDSNNSIGYILGSIRERKSTFSSSRVNCSITKTAAK